MENKVVARATNTGKYSNLPMAVHLFSAASLFFFAFPFFLTIDSWLY